MINPRIEPPRLRLKIVMTNSLQPEMTREWRAQRLYLLGNLGDARRSTSKIKVRRGVKAVRTCLILPAERNLQSEVLARYMQQATRAFLLTVLEHSLSRNLTALSPAFS